MGDNKTDASRFIRDDKPSHEIVRAYFCRETNRLARVDVRRFGCVRELFCVECGEPLQRQECEEYRGRGNEITLWEI